MRQIMQSQIWSMTGVVSCLWPSPGWLSLSQCVRPQKPGPGSAGAFCCLLWWLSALSRVWRDINYPDKICKLSGWSWQHSWLSRLEWMKTLWKMQHILCCIVCLTALQIEAAFNDTDYYFPDYEDDETKPVEVNSVHCLQNTLPAGWQFKLCYLRLSGSLTQPEWRLTRWLRPGLSRKMWTRLTTSPSPSQSSILSSSRFLSTWRKSTMRSRRNTYFRSKDLVVDFSI